MGRIFIISIALFFSCFTSTIYSASRDVTATPPENLLVRKDKDPRYKNKKLMGVEIESTNIKIKSIPTDIARSNPGFNFYTDNKLMWVLEEDTFDKAQDENNNLEAHSIGGFLQEGIRHILREMEIVYNEISRLLSINARIALLSGNIEEMLNSRGKTLVTKRYRELQALATEEEVNQNYYQDSVVELAFKNGIQQEPIVKPQITYQASLELVEIFFHRLADKFAHPRIQEYMIAIGLREPAPNLISKEQAQQKVAALFRRVLRNNTNSSAQATPTSNLLSSAQQESPAADSTSLLSIQRPADQREIIQTLLKAVSNCLRGTENRKIRGLSILFGFYCFRFFNREEINREPGLKGFLAIMSRVPFSHLYHYVLNNEEKKLFRNIFDPLIKRYGDLLLLHKYTYEVSSGSCYAVDQIAALNQEIERYNLPSVATLRTGNKISLSLWYNSIVHVPADDLIKPDILSSPPGLAQGGIFDSMGAMNDIFIPSNFTLDIWPLFELRGLTLKKEFGTVDGAIRMIYDESDWFFSASTR